MSPFLAAEGEDVLAEVRPHPASFAGRYLGDAAWLGLGALALWIQVETPQKWIGLAAFAVFALVHAAAAHQLKVTGLRFGVAMAFAATGFNVLINVLGWSLRPEAAIILVAVVAAFIAFARTEFDRARRTLYVTSRRVVLRKGLGRVHERAIDLERVESVRVTQGPWAQLCRYGTLVLTLEAKGRQKPGALAPAETLHGIPRWQEIKHRIEAALEEISLPPRDRARRAEERRLRDSMRALSGWTGATRP